MKTQKIKKRNNKSHRKRNNKSHRKRNNKSHRKRNKSAGTGWVGNGFGIGQTGYAHIGNIFTQLAKKKLLIN